jgi:DNA-binding winged helix-turn-helix (wHTH) protein/TolB-like protein
VFLESDKPLKKKPVYGFGPFRLEVWERRLFNGQEPVALTPKACEILQVLIEKAGTVVEKDELMRAVWRDVFVEEGNLTFNISMLRKALAPFECIETIPRRGYRFTAPVQEVVTPPPANRRTVNRLIVWAVVAALVVAAVLVARMTMHPRQPKSLAILPFQSLDPKQRDPVPELGLADVLVTRLGSVGDLIVRPTTSIRRYAGSNVDPAEAGRALGVDSVLSASFQRVADRVRVTAQLIDTKTGRHLWDGQFDERSTDLLALEDALSGKLAGALAAQFTPVRHATTPEVHESYLRGRVALLNWSESGAKQALSYFQHVTAADPDYAPALAGIAASLMQQVRWGAVAPREAIPRAEAAVRRALALDDSLAEAHQALGAIEMSYDWDLDSAKRELQRAIRLNPSLPDSHGALGPCSLIRESRRRRSTKGRLRNIWTHSLPSGS